MKRHDVSTDQGRAKERLRRAALTSVTSAFSRMIAMALPIITIPISLNYLGKEIYGLWMTVGSIVGMFLFADLGLGSGLLTGLSRASGRGDLMAQQKLISTTSFLLAGIALLLGAIFFALLRFIPWADLINAKTPSAREISQGVVAAIAFCFIVNIPLTTVQRCQMALQEGYQTGIWQGVGTVCGAAALVICVKSNLSPTFLMWAIAGTPLVIAAMNWWWFFHRCHPSLRPRWEYFSWNEGKHLVRFGIGFFSISILMTLGAYTDNVIIARLFDLKTVTTYSVPARMALVLSAVMNMICLPMWGANGEALARGDVAWVRMNTVRLTKASLILTGFAAICMVILGPPVLRLWLGSAFVASRWLLLGLAASAIIVSAAVPFFMVLNGAGGGAILRQAKIYCVYTPIVLVTKIVFAKLFGIAGIPFANAICYALIMLPLLATLYREVIREHSVQSVAGGEVVRTVSLSTQLSPNPDGVESNAKSLETAQ